jgi:hypothetical protein
VVERTLKKNVLLRENKMSKKMWLIIPHAKTNQA